MKLMVKTALALPLAAISPSATGNALGGVTTFHVPGDHYTIMQRPAVQKLAEILAGEIELVEGTMAEVRAQ